MKNQNGAEIGAESVRKFERWIEERDASRDWDDYVRGDKLKRKEIAAECGFGVPAFRQNPAIQALLHELEERLRAEGVLPPADGRELTPHRRASQAIDRRLAVARSGLEQRVKNLEEQNAGLRAQVDMLTKELRRYKMISEHLGETGRLLAR